MKKVIFTRFSVGYLENYDKLHNTAHIFLFHVFEYNMVENLTVINDWGSRSEWLHYEEIYSHYCSAHIFNIFTDYLFLCFIDVTLHDIQTIFNIYEHYKCTVLLNFENVIIFPYYSRKNRKLKSRWLYNNIGIIIIWCGMIVCSVKIFRKSLIVVYFINVKL